MKRKFPFIDFNRISKNWFQFNIYLVFLNDKQQNIIWCDSSKSFSLIISISLLRNWMVDELT